jgi:hypothetical protein
MSAIALSQSVRSLVVEVFHQVAELAWQIGVRDVAAVKLIKRASNSFAESSPIESPTQRAYRRRSQPRARIAWAVLSSGQDYRAVQEPVAA